MVIKQALDDLRKFVINDVEIFDRLLDIIYELNNRQHIHGNVISEIQRLLENNPLKPSWPDSPREELNRCPCCGSHEIHKYCGSSGMRYGCCCCFRRTNFYKSSGEAFEAWQAGENA